MVQAVVPGFLDRADQRAGAAARQRADGVGAQEVVHPQLAVDDLAQEAGVGRWRAFQAAGQLRPLVGQPEVVAEVGADFPGQLVGAVAAEAEVHRQPLVMTAAVRKPAYIARRKQPVRAVGRAGFHRTREQAGDRVERREAGAHRQCLDGALVRLPVLADLLEHIGAPDELRRRRDRYFLVGRVLVAHRAGHDRALAVANLPEEVADRLAVAAAVGGGFGRSGGAVAGGRFRMDRRRRRTAEQAEHGRSSGQQPASGIRRRQQERRGQVQERAPGRAGVQQFRLTDWHRVRGHSLVAAQQSAEQTATGHATEQRAFIARTPAGRRCRHDDAVGHP